MMVFLSASFIGFGQLTPADSAWAAQPSEGQIYAQPEHLQDTGMPVGIYLLILFPLFSLFVFIFRPYLRSNLQLAVRMQLADQVMREREFSSGLPGLLLHILFAVSVGGLLFYWLQNLLPQWIPDEEWISILVLSAAWPVAYMLRTLFYLVFGSIFRMRSTIGRFRFRTGILFESAGFILFPVVCLLFLSPPAVRMVCMGASAIILSILVIWRWWALIRVAGSMSGFRVSYFLLYFCAFEIAPVLAVYALLSGRSGLDF